MISSDVNRFRRIVDFEGLVSRTSINRAFRRTSISFGAISAPLLMVNVNRAAYPPRGVFFPTGSEYLDCGKKSGAPPRPGRPARAAGPPGGGPGPAARAAPGRPPGPGRAPARRAGRPLPPPEAAEPDPDPLGCRAREAPEQGRRRRRFRNGRATWVRCARVQLGHSDQDAHCRSWISASPFSPERLISAHQARKLLKWQPPREP